MAFLHFFQIFFIVAQIFLNEIDLFLRVGSDVLQGNFLFHKFCLYLFDVAE